ncbi:Aminotransferase [Corynebacterium pseudotuberculosis]|uniref:pyridoxal phosphate-dependent aminotransferase n=1 Tax=Corynebacterium pseudotuberculosis TaxID=1719 RepID=UPI0009473CD4|nr:pyridoxal phosphate-dependent aminotransferase [Corynebacterium pseudotuberculosis]APQ53714.1 Aminotransferase [Corynebacterium pseudotuberculosis]ATD14526.1 aminotransferase [Corynebacterium pseudotuberculosis]ATV79819.1 Aminotransferase [Corynebacterium pseudotuberculosis]
MRHTPGVQRLDQFGQTIFATMSAKAAEFQAINLGQGFPESNGPLAMLQRAQQEIAKGNNQYAPARGIPSLRQAIARARERNFGVSYDPDTEVLVTVGATEAISATILGLVEPGEDVLVFEPYYDSYAASIALAGAQRIAVPLIPDGRSWTLYLDAFAAAITPRTSMVIINSPHNPTGAVFDEQTLKAFAAICAERDLLVLSDEVYEHYTFANHPHVPIASLPAMRERTITVSSAAKTFNVTGWKTGWALAPAPLLEAVFKAKQFMSYVGATPFQPAIAYALEHEEAWIRKTVADTEAKGICLSDGLRQAGFDVYDTHGAFYVVADISSVTDKTGNQFCLDLPREKGVAAIPIEPFTDSSPEWNSMIRFAYCRDQEEILTAIERLIASTR